VLPAAGKHLVWKYSLEPTERAQGEIVLAIAVRIFSKGEVVERDLFHRLSVEAGSGGPIQLGSVIEPLFSALFASLPAAVLAVRGGSKNKKTKKT